MVENFTKDKGVEPYPKGRPMVADDMRRIMLKEAGVDRETIKDAVFQVKEALEAKDVRLDKFGDKVDCGPAWPTRLKAADMILDIAGYKPKASGAQIGKGAVIEVVIKPFANPDTVTAKISGPTVEQPKGSTVPQLDGPVIETVTVKPTQTDE